MLPPTYCCSSLLSLPPTARLLLRLLFPSAPSLLCVLIFPCSLHRTRRLLVCPPAAPLTSTLRLGSYWVNVVVTAYNEIGQDLEDTLASLEAQAEVLQPPPPPAPLPLPVELTPHRCRPQNLAEGCKMHVLVVFDGWWKVAPCMKRSPPPSRLL